MARGLIEREIWSTFSLQGRSHKLAGLERPSNRRAKELSEAW
jgi:hypothetical protein